MHLKIPTDSNWQVCINVMPIYFRMSTITMLEFQLLVFSIGLSLAFSPLIRRADNVQRSRPPEITEVGP